jgi:hypothetical protein
LATEFVFAVHGAAWLSAVLSAAALLVTLWVVLFRDRRERLEMQARKVSAWVDSVHDLRAENEFGAVIAAAGGLRGKSVKIAVHNGSDEPAYDFVPTVWSSYAPDAGKQTIEPVMVRPGESFLWVDGVELPEGGPAGHPWVDIEFKDAQERRWQRAHDGAFRQVGGRGFWPLETVGIVVGATAVALASIALAVALL